jgi:hypothetical protein
MRQTLKSALPDALLVAGGASVSFGAWLAWSPSGYIVGGILAIIAGLKLAAA